MEEPATALAQRQAEGDTLLDIPATLDPVRAREPQTDRNVLRNGSPSRFEHLEYEPHPVFERSTVRIRALVCDRRVVRYSQRPAGSAPDPGHRGIGARVPGGHAGELRGRWRSSRPDSGRPVDRRSKVLHWRLCAQHGQAGSRSASKTARAEPPVSGAAPLRSRRPRVQDRPM